MMQWVKLFKRRSTLCGLGVFLFGFVMLVAFWFSVDQNDSLPGLFDYPSATWGDGLLLPMLAIALTHMIGLLPRPQNRWPARIGAVTGFVGGALVIAGWLIDSNPGLNWTMPQPHSFNLAGGYHAAFLMLSSGLFTGLWVELLYRLREAIRAVPTYPSAAHLTGSGWFAVAIGASLGYASLSGMDSGEVASTGAGAASLTALSASSLVLLLALGLALRGELRRLVSPVFCGLCLAWSALSLALFAPVTLSSLLITFMAVAIGLSLAFTADPVSAEGQLVIGPNSGGSPVLEWLAIPALFAIVPMLTARTELSTENALRLSLLLVLIAGAVLVMRWLRRGVWEVIRDRRWLMISAVFVGISCGILLLEKIPDISFFARPIALAALGTFMAKIVLKRCEKEYDALMKMEMSAERAANDGLATPTEHDKTRGIWGRIAAGASAAVAGIIGLTVVSAPSVGWIVSSRGIWLNSASVLLAFVGLAMLVFTSPALRQFGRKRKPGLVDQTPHANTMAEVATLLSGLFLFAASAAAAATDGVLHPVAALQSALIALFVSECILGNGLRLNLATVGWRAWWVVIAAGLGVFGIVYWSLTGGVGSAQGPAALGWSLLAVVLSIAMAALLAFAGTAVAYGIGSKVYLTQYTPFANAAQDIFLVSLMWLVAAWIPQTVVEHIPLDDGGALSRGWRVAVVLFAIVFLYFYVLVWILGNNETHAGRERKKKGLKVLPFAEVGASPWTRAAAMPRRLLEYAKKPQGKSLDEEQATALDGHTAVQNVLAIGLAFTAIVSIVPAVFHVIGDEKPSAVDRDS